MLEMINKISWPLLLGIIGGLLAIIGAVQQWHEKKIETKKSEIAQRKIEELQLKTLKKAEELANSYKNNLTLQSKLNDKSDNIIVKTNELASSYQQNAELQREINNQLTGGDSKPTLSVYVHTTQTGNVIYYITNFDVINLDKYPLHQVSVGITDYSGAQFQDELKVTRTPHGGSRYENIQPGERVNVQTYQKFELSTIKPTQKLPVYSSVFRVLNGKENPHYFVEINWSSGSMFISFKTKINNESVELIEPRGSINNKEVDINKYLHFQFIK